MQGSIETDTKEPIVIEYPPISTKAEIKRTVRIPKDHRVTVPVPYSRGKVFRVTHLIEEFLINTDRALDTSYRITVRGPVLNKDGNDHANQTSGHVYGDWQTKIADFPAALEEFTVGKGAMQAVLNPVSWDELSEI